MLVPVLTRVVIVRSAHKPEDKNMNFHVIQISLACAYMYGF
jgi:hypothetical protein